MSSLYAKYIKEREDKDIIETDKGFATYAFYPDGCYIESIYVLPEFRQHKEASDMADKIAEMARAKGYKKLFGSVCPTAKGSTTSMKVLLLYGFKIVSSQNNFIVLEKEI